MALRLGVGGVARNGGGGRIAETGCSPGPAEGSLLSPHLHLRGLGGGGMNLLMRLPPPHHPEFFTCPLNPDSYLHLKLPRHRTEALSLWTLRKHCLSKQMSQGPRRKAHAHRGGETLGHPKVPAILAIIIAQAPREKCSAFCTECGCSGSNLPF